jgi:hypothetical protein
MLAHARRLKSKEMQTFKRIVFHLVSKSFCIFGRQRLLRGFVDALAVVVQGGCVWLPRAAILTGPRSVRGAFAAGRQGA